MVPYIRKSFFKHWKNGCKYILKDEKADDLVFFEDKTIEDSYYQNEAYQYAIDMTKKEVYQSIEAMLHNLNSLQSRSRKSITF